MTQSVDTEPTREEIPLVLLHGFPFNSSMWDDVVDLLSQENVPTIAIDAPGLGSSPIPEGEPALETAADGVIATLEDLGIERAVVAGLSMGGYIALAIAQRHPSAVAGLALLDTKASLDTEQARANRLRVADQAEREQTSDAVAGMWEVLLGETTKASEPDVVALHQAWLAAAPPAGITWGQRAMAARPARFEVLERLAVPGLVVRGAEDVLSTAADAAAMVAALEANDGAAHLVEIPAVGHMTATEDPEATAQALADFWRRCTAG